MELRRSWIVGLIEALEKAIRRDSFEAASLAFSCAEHVQQLGGESPLPILMEEKG